MRKVSLRERCPNTEFSLVFIFLYSVWIQQNMDQEKLRIWTVLQSLMMKTDIVEFGEEIDFIALEVD